MNGFCVRITYSLAIGGCYIKKYCCKAESADIARKTAIDQFYSDIIKDYQRIPDGILEIDSCISEKYD